MRNDFFPAVQIIFILTRLGSQVMRLSELCDSQVKCKDGFVIGQTVDVWIDPKTGRITHLVVDICSDAVEFVDWKKRQAEFLPSNFPVMGIILQPVPLIGVENSVLLNLGAVSHMDTDAVHLSIAKEALNKNTLQEPVAKECIMTEKEK